MLFDANLATKYWGEAIMTACYLQNRLPTRATDKTPYHIWNGEKPDLQHIRAFGSKAYAHVPKEKRTKWDSHSVEGVLVGYNETSNGYRILHPSTGKITICRSVVFDEKFATNQKFFVISDVQKANSDTVEQECLKQDVTQKDEDDEIEVDNEEGMTQ